jgi:hypothetical protein
MSYASITVAPELNVADYHAIGEHLGPDPVQGLLSEVAGAADAGLHVITLWDSKEEHDRFVADRLVPAFQRAGIQPGELRFTDVDVDRVYQRGC